MSSLPQYSAIFCASSLGSRRKWKTEKCRRSDYSSQSASKSEIFCLFYSYIRCIDAIFRALCRESGGDISYTQSDGVHKPMPMSWWQMGIKWHSTRSASRCDNNSKSKSKKRKIFWFQIYCRGRIHTNGMNLLNEAPHWTGTHIHLLFSSSAFAIDLLLAPVLYTKHSCLKNEEMERSYEQRHCSETASRKVGECLTCLRGKSVCSEQRKGRNCEIRTKKNIYSKRW